MVLRLAQRMCWAACRVTSRPEDRAYSLLGLFDVRMPLNYGEGHEAFKRLQAELLEVTPVDWTILVWESFCSKTCPADTERCPTSILAPSPDCFHSGKDIVQHTNKEWGFFWDTFSTRICHGEGFADPILPNGGEIQKISGRIKLQVMRRTITKQNTAGDAECLLTSRYPVMTEQMRIKYRALSS